MTQNAINIPDIPAISRALWTEFKSVTAAADALYDQAVNDPELYRSLTEGYLKAACSAAIQRVANAQKVAYKPGRIETVREVITVSTPGRGRPRIYGTDLTNDILTMSIGGRQLGILTKKDIFEHLAIRAKALSAELNTHAWLRRIANGLTDNQTVAQVYDEATLTAMKAATFATDDDALAILPVIEEAEAA